MYQDEVICEVWRIRDAYAAEHHNDLKEIVADLQKRQLRTGNTVVDRRPARSPEAVADAEPQTRRSEKRE
jgi:hypothetical protein